MNLDGIARTPQPGPKRVRASLDVGEGLRLEWWEGETPEIPLFPEVFLDGKRIAAVLAVPIMARAILGLRQALRGRRTS